MNDLEKIALEKLRQSVISARDRTHERNEGRMEHERIFIKRDLDEAMMLIKALQANDKR